MTRTEKENPASSEKVSRRRSLLWEYTESIAIAIVLALFIRTFVVQAFKIPSGSMEPTLLIGDHLLVNKFIYGITVPFTDHKLLVLHKPQREDVIVFIYPVDKSKDFIKRVIGVEGDTILIKGEKVFINDELYGDARGYYSDDGNPRGNVRSRPDFGPVTVPEESLFVMGDNRDKSYDSRFWGFVPVDQVKGKAFIIYWSWGGLFQDIRWKRIGNTIH